MKRYWLALAMSFYLASGFFVVPANEKAVVRRFGRVAIPLRSSGLNYDLPWPFVRIDRVNFHEMRTLSLGDLNVDTSFLTPTAAVRPMNFLTGDKNLLLLRITVQYRVSEDGVADWLFSSSQPIERLRSVVETTTADLVLRSGVDFVHTQGLTALNNRLLIEVRDLAHSLRLGCEIEQLTIDRVEPPARVKADFLDVSNARAEMAKEVHQARGYAEQAVAESRGEARKITDTAVREQRSMISGAQASADKFVLFVDQITQDATEHGRTYSESRQLVMQRLTLESIQAALQRAKLKIVLEGDRPIDLTFPREMN